MSLGQQYYGRDWDEAGASGFGEYFATKGMGAYFTQQPPAAPTSGLGALPLVSPVGAALSQNDARIPMGGGAGWTALGLALLAGVGWLSYQSGKAMAPTGTDRVVWGWVGVPVGLLTGPIGLGIMGVISNQRRRI